MKHLIETAGLSGLPITEYDRIILNSSTDDIIVRGGGNANILMLSETGYQLYGVEGDNGQINYWVFEYTDTEKYNNKEYFKYVFADKGYYILAPTRNITKVTFPFDDYYIYTDAIMPLSSKGYDSLYGFTSVPENKVVMKRRTDIGTNANGKDYVDLGLTSGTLWATMNVGATIESDYGSYFQWGLTTPNTKCNWSTYTYGDGSNFSKYNTGLNNIGGTIDNKITLDLEDDAARARMGGDWRIPSPALMEELISETNSEWVNRYNGTTKSGRKFTGPNGNSIFIPAAGYRWSSSFYYTDSDGCYWSSSLDAANPGNALYLDFFINGSFDANDSRTRGHGFPVRGVL